MPEDLFRLPDTRKREWLNYLHSESPEVGDYWHEMFCPWFTVLDVDQHNVRVAQHIGPGKSEDLTMTRGEFKTRLRYGTSGLENKCIGDVAPKRYAAKVRELNLKQKGDK